LVARSQCGPSLELTVSATSEALRVALVGELDMAGASAFADCVIARLTEHDVALILDCVGLLFCDSTGINALIKIRRYCGHHDRSLTLTNVQANVRRVLVDLSGLSGYLGIQQPGGLATDRH
jgi:anti-anti-sigma factor